jgi:hypothetical protein
MLSENAPLANAQKFNRNRPSVYITFKEFLAKTPDQTYPSQGALLQVHNNTRWPIYFTEHYDPTAAGAQIHYSIVRADGCPELRQYVDVVMKRKLMPGKTLDLIVPKDNFPDASKIYVSFNYSWELVEGDRLSNETVHSAYFHSSDLPAWPSS